MEKTDISVVPKRLKWFFHLLLWSVLLAFPFFFMWRNPDSISWAAYSRFLIMLTGVIVVFYTNYLYWVKRFLFSRQMRWFVVYNLVLFTALIVVSHYLFDIIPHDENHKPPLVSSKGEFFVRFIFFDYMKYILVAAFSVAMKMTNSWYQADAERKELEKMRSEAELQNLKSQLNPHFLFNTLNNIYSLIAISTEHAQEAVHMLSRLLRYILYDSSQPLVTIGKDLDFIHNYIELMKIRLPKHVEVKTEIQIQSLDSLIAPLLFISPIENAFKHGVSNNNPCFIEIRILSGEQEVRCVIRNSYFPKSEEDKSGSGIGVANLQKRLNLLYPTSHSFVCRHEGEVFHSELTVTLSQ